LQRGVASATRLYLTTRRKRRRESCQWLPSTSRITKMNTRTKRVAVPLKVVRSAPRKSGDWEFRRTGTLEVLRAPRLAEACWLVHGFSTRAGGASELPPGDASDLGNGKRGGSGDSEKPAGAFGRAHEGWGKARQSPAKGREGNRENPGVLNLGFTDWDARERVAENREKFFRGIGARKFRAVTLRQIHSDVVHVIAGAPSSANAVPDSAPQGDALVTAEAGILLAVQTADCVPILLADMKRKAVAAIHSGWRGTRSRIAAKTLGRMRMEFGTRPEDVVAAIGPGIGRCCYEVGEDVAREFHAQFPNAHDWFEGPFDALASGENDPNWLPWLTMKPPGHQPPPLRAQLDLIAANRAILEGAGIPAGQISAADLCTACRTDLFFSYRREQPTGRMIAAIGII
jgi:polyphenol oxidase